MIFYPKLYLKNVTKITLEMLKENDIKAMILDMDNTLLDFDKNVIDGGLEWIEKLKAVGIKVCIVSNSAHKDKVEMLSEKLKIEDYIYFAMKPLKTGMKKALKILNEDSKNIAVVGDQIFTDVLAANRCKMFSILVEPIKEQDIWATKIKRPLEKLIIKKYKEKANERRKEVK